MNSRLGRVATIAVLSALAVLVVSSVASAQWRQERIRLPYWQLSDGSVQTSSVHRPLMAAPDRLLVGLEQPSGIMLSPLAPRRFPRNPGRIADAVGGRIKRFLGGGSLAVVDLPVGSDLYAAADKLRRAGAVFVEPDGRYIWSGSPTIRAIRSSTITPRSNLRQPGMSPSGHDRWSSPS